MEGREELFEHERHKEPVQVGIVVNWHVRNGTGKCLTARLNLDRVKEPIPFLAANPPWPSAPTAGLRFVLLAARWDTVVRKGAGPKREPDAFNFSAYAQQNWPRQVLSQMSSRL